MMMIHKTDGHKWRTLDWFKTFQNYSEYSMSCNFWVPSLLIQYGISCRGAKSGESGWKFTGSSLGKASYMRDWRNPEAKSAVNLPSILSICMTCGLQTVWNHETKCVKPASARFLLLLWDMYVCMSLCLSASTSLCVYDGCTDVCLSVWMFGLIFILYVCTFVCKCLSMYLRVPMYADVRQCMPMYAYMYAWLYMHTWFWVRMRSTIAFHQKIPAIICIHTFMTSETFIHWKMENNYIILWKKIKTKNKQPPQKKQPQKNNRPPKKRPTWVCFFGFVPQ